MIVQSGLRKGFETTWVDSGLFARVTIFDITTGTPEDAMSVDMEELVPGTYFASFLPQAGRAYVAVKRVYTDGTYSAVNPDYSTSSEAFQCVDFASQSAGAVTGGDIVGIVSDNALVGVVEE